MHTATAIRALAKGLSFVVAAGLILALAYLLGYTLLTGPLRGNDSALHLGYVVWLNQYFPDVPHWYPLQGGGVSLLHGYPLLPHLLIVLTHRLSGLSILQSFRLISFLSFPLTALGLYLFCWSALRKQTVGLIAALFYLVAPVTWTWLYDWGFFAQQVALIFLPPALAAFDQVLECSRDERRSHWRQFWFAALVILLLLTSLSHMLVGAAAAVGMTLYTLGAALLAPREKRKVVLRSGMQILLLLALTLGCLAAVYFVPFYQYGQVANREGLSAPAPQQLHRLPIREFFGLGPINPAEILTRMQFPFGVTAFGLIGICLAIVSMWKRAAEARKILTLSLAASAATIYVLTPELVALVLKLQPLLQRLFNFRSQLLLVMVLMPVIAAYGVWSLAHTLLYPSEIFRLHPKPKTPSETPPFSVRPALVSLLSLLIALGGLGWLWSFTAQEPSFVAYGPLPKGINLHDLWHRRADESCGLPAGRVGRATLCDVPLAREQLNIEEFNLACAQLQAQGVTQPPLCQASPPTEALVAEFLKQCQVVTDFSGTWLPCRARLETVIAQLQFKNWPAFMLDNRDPDLAYSQHLAATLPEAGLRIDISPYLGRLAEDLSGFAQASQINSYAFQINLIHAMWGYQQNVFYSHEASGSEYGNPQTLNELAQWFGTEYVFLSPDRDSVETYLAAGWQPVLQNQASEILEHPTQPGYLFLDQNDPALETYQKVGWKPVAFKGPVELWRYPTDLSLATLTTRPAVLVIGKQKTDAYMTLFRLANDGLLPYSKALSVEGRPEVDQYTLEELRPFAALVLYGYDYQNSRRAWEILSEYVQQGGSLFVDTGWEFQVPEWEFTQAPEVLPVERLTWTNYGMTRDYRLSAPEIAGEINTDLFQALIWEGQPWSVSGAQPDEVRDWGQVVLSAVGHPLIVGGEYGSGRVIWSGMNLIAHATSGGRYPEELRLVSNLLDWLIKEKAGADLASPGVTRTDPDRVDFSLKVAPGQTNWLYWREAYYPDWQAYLNDDQGQQSLPIYRGGPGFMLMPIQTSSTEVSVKLVWEASPIEKAAAGVSLLGVGLFLALMVDGVFLGGRGLAGIKQRIAARRRAKPVLKPAVMPQWPEPPLEED